MEAQHHHGFFCAQSPDRAGHRRDGARERHQARVHAHARSLRVLRPVVDGVPRLPAAVRAGIGVLLLLRLLRRLRALRQRGAQPQVRARRVRCAIRVGHGAEDVRERPRRDGGHGPRRPTRVQHVPVGAVHLLRMLLPVHLLRLRVRLLRHSVPGGRVSPCGRRRVTRPIIFCFLFWRRCQIFNFSKS